MKFGRCPSCHRMRAVVKASKKTGGVIRLHRVVLDDDRNYPIGSDPWCPGSRKTVEWSRLVRL